MPQPEHLHVPKCPSSAQAPHAEAYGKHNPDKLCPPHCLCAAVLQWAVMLPFPLWMRRHQSALCT